MKEKRLLILTICWVVGGFSVLGVLAYLLEYHGYYVLVAVYAFCTLYIASMVYDGLWWAELERSAKDAGMCNKEFSGWCAAEFVSHRGESTVRKKKEGLLVLCEKKCSRCLE